MNKLRYLLLAPLLLAACSNPSPVQTEVTSDSATGIVGGTEVSPGSREMYSTVGLYDKQSKSLCTGSLISENLVLTAGHCIGDDPKQMVVIFKQKFDDAQPENIRVVTAAKRHAQYNPKQSRNTADIAVIKFDSSAGLPQGYGPAKLLPNFSLLQPGARIVAVGYGLSKSWIFKSGAGVLRTTELKVKDGFSETEIMIDQSLKKGVCSGDSGGPGYMDVDGQLYLWGVVSRGDSIPIPLTPNCFLFSVYTRVDVYAPWIIQAANELLAL